MTTESPSSIACTYPDSSSSNVLSWVVATLYTYRDPLKCGEGILVCLCCIVRWLWECVGDLVDAYPHSSSLFLCSRIAFLCFSVVRSAYFLARSFRSFISSRSEPLLLLFGGQITCFTVTFDHPTHQSITAACSAPGQSASWGRRGSTRPRSRSTRRERRRVALEREGALRVCHVARGGARGAGGSQGQGSGWGLK